MNNRNSVEGVSNAMCGVGAKTLSTGTTCWNRTTAIPQAPVMSATVQPDVCAYLNVQLDAERPLRCAARRGF